MADNSEHSLDSKPRFSCVRVLRGLAYSITLILTVATLASFGARAFWVLDLATHFPVQIASGAFCAALILLLVRDLKGALVPAVVFVFNVLLVVPLYIPSVQPDGSGDELCIVSTNVYTGNKNSQAVIDYVHETKPDVLLLMEVDNRWTDELIEIRAEYPHSLQRPREDNFGISLFSKWPIKSARVEYLDAAQLPTLVTVLQVGERQLTVVGTHPLPPVSESNTALRNEHLQRLATLVAELEGPVIVIGDLNTTSWSPYFRELIATSRLRDSRRGFGIQPTWPFSFWLLRIPIDHALVSKEIEVTSRQVGPNIGSDHRPIVVKIRLPEDS